MSETKYPDFPSSPNNGDIHIHEDEIYVWDATAQKQEATGAWIRNESEVYYIDYLKKALVDIHNLKARLSALESS
tara:strand:+ start:1529 stop:1753 length:225 start_codon:yes stop_codon:yes gene_type:complete